MRKRQPNLELAKSIYLRAAEYVSIAGLQREVTWQRETSLHSFSERDLLRESAWVILCSGFREATVKQMFDYLSLCFFDWESSALICLHEEVCLGSALSIFSNRPKLTRLLQWPSRCRPTALRRLSKA
jgi:hypothetical protein